jgi:hypothetical protein
MGYLIAPPATKILYSHHICPSQNSFACLTFISQSWKRAKPVAVQEKMAGSLAEYVRDEEQWNSLSPRSRNTAGR